MQEVPLEDNQETHPDQHKEEQKQSVSEPALNKTDSNPYANAITKDEEKEEAAQVPENPFHELIAETPSTITEEKK